MFNAQKQVDIGFLKINIISLLELQMNDENLNDAAAENELFTGTEKSLRPTCFDEYIGQEKIIKQLKIHIGGEKIRRENGTQDAPEHLLFEGPAGLGKTSIAFVIANELGSKVRVMQAPTIQKIGDLLANVSVLDEGDVLFIDEIHSLSKEVSEALYSVAEDFRFDITADGKVLNIPLPHFTLVGATTDLGKLAIPLQDRFTHKFTLQKYTESELIEIILRSAKVLGYEIEIDAARALAQCAKGTPRIANNLLKKTRNYAELNNRVITHALAIEALSDAGVNVFGLGINDVKYLTCLFDKAKPVGLKTLSGMTSIDEKTVENTIEPFLLENGFIEKHPRGRIITDKGVVYINQLNGTQD